MAMHSHRVLVVGASAAGLRCACRLARLQPHWQITVIEQRDIFSYAACGLPYVLSGDIDQADELRRTADGTLRDADYFRSVKGIEVRTGWRASRLNAAEHTLDVEDRAGQKETLDWDDLILATGASPRRLPEQPHHARVQSFHTYEDLAALHQGLTQGKIRRVAVVGAGLVGCELAEAFTAMWGAELTLLEAAGTALPMLLDEEVGRIVDQTLRSNEIELLTGHPVESIEADDSGVRIVAGSRACEADVAVVALGVRPVVELAEQAGVELGPTGALAVTSKLATNLPHVWAVGDCAELQHQVREKACCLPLGSLANRQGRTLANILAGREDEFLPVVGSAAIKVFDTNVAVVGVTRAQALAEGRPARSVWTHAHDRADYWPESKDFALHVVYDADSEKVLGVQAVGEGEVAKRVDVAAQLMAHGANLQDLARLEHAYAPPYAPAIDPLAVAAFVAQNQQDGVLACSPLETLDGWRILDVRMPEETKAQPIKAADVTVIPLEEVRSRMAELTGERWLVICARGTRSAELVRLFGSRGIEARYLGGGMAWRMYAGVLER